MTAAVAGTVIGFGALGAAASAAADPVPPLVPGEPAAPGQPVIEPAPAGQPVGGDVVAAPPPVGPPMVPEIAEPQVRLGAIGRPVGLPAGCLASGQGSVQLRRNAGRPDAGRRPTAGRCRSRAAAAARLQIVERPGFRSPGVGAAGRPGHRGGRSAAARGLLPDQRPTSSRLFRRPSPAECTAGNGTDSGWATADALGRRQPRLGQLCEVRPRSCEQFGRGVLRVRRRIIG